MDWVYQHPKDLVLAVYHGQPKQNMLILKQQTLHIENWQIEFRIIGESHAVLISDQHGQIQFSEVFSCLPVDSAQCVHYQNFETLEPYQLNTSSYQVAVSIDTHLPHWPNDVHISQMQVDFPSVHGTTPFTRVSWQHRANQIQWWTIHTYPFDSTTTNVYTHSIFDIGLFEKGDFSK